jgi:hypothetical protein
MQEEWMTLLKRGRSGQEIRDIGIPIPKVKDGDMLVDCQVDRKFEILVYLFV